MRNIISDVVIHTKAKENTIDKIDLEIEANITKRHMELGGIVALTENYALKAYSFLDNEISNLEYTLNCIDEALVISYEVILNIMRDIYKETAEPAELIEIHEVDSDELKAIKVKNGILGINSLSRFKNKALIFQVSNKIEIYSTDIVFTTTAFKFQDTSKYWLSNIRDISDKPIAIKLYKEAKELDYKSYEDKLKADYIELITYIKKEVAKLIEAKSV